MVELDQWLIKISKTRLKNHKMEFYQIKLVLLTGWLTICNIIHLVKVLMQWDYSMQITNQDQKMICLFIRE